MTPLEHDFEDVGTGEFGPPPAGSTHGKASPSPDINYLARDYAGFRQLMLNRLSLLLPPDTDLNPAGLGMAIVESLAYTADQLSYYQDAVATEAYLGTARRRISVRRHARLVDYAMHEGCNARVWVQLQVNSGEVKLAKGTALLTGQGGPAVIEPNSSAYQQALSEGAEVFETLHAATLYQAHNEINFHTGGETQFTLPRGTMHAALKVKAGTPALQLQVGDVLIFEEVKGARNDLPDDAEPSRRHAVRLTKVGPSGSAPDADDPTPIVKIEWAEADALPFDLSVAAGGFSDLSVACGNIVLADHGRTLSGTPLPLVTSTGRYRPTLPHVALTHGEPYNHAVAVAQPAAQAMAQDPRVAVPAIRLRADGSDWDPQRHLLASSPQARHFVVEMEGDRSAHLRFGDGRFGRQPAPDTKFTADYEIGNGTQGNVGAEAISHVVTANTSITLVRNPLAAAGGVDPEPLEHVRLVAPQAFKTQLRCVTAADYARMAEGHPTVRRATAEMRWTGSWGTVFIYVERHERLPVDNRFAEELVGYLERYRQAGVDLAIRAPLFVPVDIAMTVYCRPGHLRSNVKQALLDRFSDVTMADGQPGFFHPDQFTLGQPLYSSPIIAAAVQVAGVARVEVTNFGRVEHLGKYTDTLEAGRIAVGPQELIRLDNDPAAPQNGQIEFTMKDAS